MLFLLVTVESLETLLNVFLSNQSFKIIFKSYNIWVYIQGLYYFGIITTKLSFRAYFTRLLHAVFLCIAKNTQKL